MQLLFVLLFIKKFFSTDIGLLYELGDIRRLMGKELFEVFSSGEPTWYLKRGAEACRTRLSSAGHVPTWYLKRGAEAR